MNRIALFILLFVVVGCKSGAPPVQSVATQRFAPTYQLANDTLVTDYLEVLSGYRQIKEALNAGNPERATGAADSLLQAVANFLDHAPKDTSALSHSLRKHANDLRAPAHAIQLAGVLADQRQHFYGLSQYLLSLVKDFGTGGLYLRQYSNPRALNNRAAYWFETDSLPDDPYGTPAGAQASLTGIFVSGSEE
jgi:Protein of unknown function (DUF3347)